jgi:pantetheine-phosphate adenylyltransferase
MTKRVAIYPGTFDPITNGHMDIIRRATRLCDKLVVGVAINPDKGPLFTLDERVALVNEELAALTKAGKANGCEVEARPFSILLMHFAMECGATMIVRGLRAVSDFEYEFQMAGMNARLNDKIETVFLAASERNHFIASNLVKVIARMGGDIASFVSANVATRLIAAVAAERARRAPG